MVVGEEEKRTELRTQLVNKTTCESLVIVFVGRDMKRYRHQRTPHPSTQSWWEPFSHSLFRLGTSAKQLPLFNLSTVGGFFPYRVPLLRKIALHQLTSIWHAYLSLAQNYNEQQKRLKTILRALGFYKLPADGRRWRQWRSPSFCAEC